MATFEGQGTGTTGASSYTLRLVVNEDSYSIANNTSSISWALYLISTGYNFALWGFPISANVDGEVYSSSEQRSISKNSTLLIGSGTKTISHNSDGTKSIECSASVSATGAYYLPGNMYISGTMALTTIPRTSSVSCSSFNIGDATTITISRASSSFTHTLEWYFGSASGTIATQTSSTSVGYTIPAVSLYAQIPNSTYGTGTIKCYTYSGNTHIGTSTCNFTAYAKQSECVPTVTVSVVDTNGLTTPLTQDANTLVKGVSNARVTVGATANNSSTITGYYVTTGDGRTSTNATTTFVNINSNTFSIQVTDSRGYVTTKSVVKSPQYWVDYIKPTFTTAQVIRSESTGDTATINLAGNYFNGYFNPRTHTPSNTLTLSYRYKETTVSPTISGNTFSYTNTLQNLSHNTEYVFDFKIVDRLITMTQSFVLTRGIPILRVAKDYISVGGVNFWRKYIIDGNEYQTNEKYYGKPVYMKTFDCGSLPNNTSSTIAHNLNMTNVLRIEGMAYIGSAAYPLPYVEPTSSNNIGIYVNSTNIVIFTGKNYSNGSAVVTIFYTKT